MLSSLSPLEIDGALYWLEKQKAIAILEINRVFSRQGKGM